MSATTADRPTVFVSYSHKDEVWKDRLVTHLKALELQGDLAVWDDRRIAAGDDWFPEIEEAMNRAAVAVLLVSPEFLASGFIRGTEVPHLLKRRQEGGLRVIPLFVRPSTWKAVDWLTAIQGRPKDAKALSRYRKAKADELLADLALEIRGLLTPCPPLPSPSPQPVEGEPGSGGIAKTGPDASPLSRGTGVRWERGTGGEVRLAIGRLPVPGPLLIGREPELARLDAAWKDPAFHLLVLVAFGGMGKSALVSHWMDGMAAAGWPGARRVFDWSFYSQGTEERVTSADRFLDHALAWFGDPDPKA
ncbi:MAG TPA: TIR domain-containing protein, partial [Thermoanaerobaculia bacterium]|nr:TIR domain-containing protein [Thermoanaerobaculia bacterium]